MKKLILLAFVLILTVEVVSAELEIQNERNMDSIVLKTREGIFDVTDVYSTKDEGKFKFNELCWPSKDVSLFTVKLEGNKLDTYKKDKRICFSHPDLFISKNKNLTLNINYTIDNFLKYNSTLNLFKIEYETYSYLTNMNNVDVKTTINLTLAMDYSRQTKDSYYIPYVYHPFPGKGEWDPDMNIEVQQEPPVFKISKKIDKSNDWLYFILYFPLVESPKLNLVFNDELDLAKNNNVESTISYKNNYDKDFYLELNQGADFPITFNIKKYPSGMLLKKQSSDVLFDLNPLESYHFDYCEGFLGIRSMYPFECLIYTGRRVIQLNPSDLSGVNVEYRISKLVAPRGFELKQDKSDYVLLIEFVAIKDEPLIKELGLATSFYFDLPSKANFIQNPIEKTIYSTEWEKSIIPHPATTAAFSYNIIMVRPFFREIFLPFFVILIVFPISLFLKNIKLFKNWRFRFLMNLSIMVGVIITFYGSSIISAGLDKLIQLKSIPLWIAIIVVLFSPFFKFKKQ